MKPVAFTFQQDHGRRPLASCQCPGGSRRWTSCQCRIGGQRLSGGRHPAVRTLMLAVLLFTLLLPLLLAIAGCSSVSDEQKRIYDDNSRIARQGDTYFFKSRVGNSDNRGMAITFSEFNGKQTVWTLQSGSSTTVDLAADANIAGGRFKVCLVSPSREVTPIFEGSHKGPVKLTVPAGKSEVVLVGQSARGELAIAWGAPEGVQIQRTGSD